MARGQTSPEEGAGPAVDAFEFGTFKLVPSERALYEDDRLAEIGGSTSCASSFNTPVFS